MTSRRKARECALQMLFQWDLGKDSPEKVRELFWGNTMRGADESPETPEDEASIAFANELMAGTVGSVRELDAVIRQHAEHWRLERMPAVDRNILRMAIYELTHLPDTPPAVVINEALEIARRFSEEESVAFINGLLDAVRKDDASTSPAKA